MGANDKTLDSFDSSREISSQSIEEGAKATARYMLWDLAHELEGYNPATIGINVVQTITPVDGKVIDVLMDPGLVLSEQQKQVMQSQFDTTYGVGSAENGVVLQFVGGNQIKISIPVEIARSLFTTEHFEDAGATEVVDGLLAEVRAAQQQRVATQRGIGVPQQSESPSRPPRVVGDGASVVVGKPEVSLDPAENVVTGMVDPAQVSQLIRDLCAQLGQSPTRSFDVTPRDKSPGHEVPAPITHTVDDAALGEVDLDDILADAAAAIDEQKIQ